MIHSASTFAAHSPAIRVSVSSERLGAIVREQLMAISAEGYADFDVRWNGVALSIEARNDRAILRRDFTPVGTLALEKIVGAGITVERFFDTDGIALVHEHIYADSDDR